MLRCKLAALRQRVCSAKRRFVVPAEPEPASGARAFSQQSPPVEPAVTGEWTFTSATEELFSRVRHGESQLGVAWHAWQLFVACLPVAGAYFMLKPTRERRLQREQAALTAGKKRVSGELGKAKQASDIEQLTTRLERLEALVVAAQPVQPAGPAQPVQPGSTKPPQVAAATAPRPASA